MEKSNLSYHYLRRKLGFSKTSNFALFSVLGGILFAFSASQLSKIDVRSNYCSFDNMTAAPSECFWYMRGPSRYFVGITLHLALVLPAAMLAVLQFVPALRQRYPAYHRRAGYASTAMVLGGAASAFLLADRAFGGTFSTRGGVGFLGLASAAAIWKAWRGIREGRVDRHRRWMLRAWAWLGAIVTMRPIMILGAVVISQTSLSPDTYMPMSCEQLRYVFEFKNRDHANASASAERALYAAYPLCAPGHAALNPSGSVLVKADALGGSMFDRPDIMGAAVNAVFGMGLWLGLALNSVAVEWYLSRTQDEDRRLKGISEVRMAKRAAKAE